MNKEDPFHLRPLWDSLIDVYKEYAKICEEHNLRYFLCAGTVLGALRHGGFIPWDDDFDVIMPRLDYEKFLKIAPKELPSHLKIVDRHNSEFRLLFAKVQDCRKEKVVLVEKQIGHILSNGIYVDVFPLDGYPKTSTKRKLSRIWEAACFSYHRYITRKARPPAKTLGGKISTCIGFLLSPCFLFRNERSILDLAEKHIKKYPFSNDEMSGAAGCQVGRFERVIPPYIFGRPRLVDFDGVMMPIPERAEELMRNFYGDYMKLPPLEKRVLSHEYATRCPWWLGPTNMKENA